MGALSATWEKKYREPFEPLVPGFSHVPYNNLEALSAAVNDTTAAVILEVVQGEGGVTPGQAEYLRGAQALCHAKGALLIFDEVQTGFGRTGRMFACQHYDLHPDLLCVAKSIAGGLPMGAVLARRKGGQTTVRRARFHLWRQPAGLRGRAGSHRFYGKQPPARARRRVGRLVPRTAKDHPVAADPRGTRAGPDVRHRAAPEGHPLPAGADGRKACWPCPPG